MSLSLNIPLDAQERLRIRAERTGLSREDAAREVLAAAETPPDSMWDVLGMILLVLLLSKMDPSPDVEEAIRISFQPYVDHLLKNGSEEQLTALLPKMPDSGRLASSPERSLLELEGLGAHLWQGVDAQEYIHEIRSEWDHRL